MSSAFKLIPYYTYKDWLHWEGKWELIGGMPFAMSPAPVPKHQRVAASLNYELINALKKSKCKTCKVYQPIDYKITDDTILIPDLLIVCKQIEKKFLDFAPSLIVEILSPSTAIKDRNTKFALYEQEGVKYYLIVDVDKILIEIYELKDGKYTLQPKENFEFRFEGDCKIIPDFRSIWG